MLFLIYKDKFHSIYSFQRKCYELVIAFAAHFIGVTLADTDMVGFFISILIVEMVTLTPRLGATSIPSIFL